jgi:hypothetical protein
MEEGKADILGLYMITELHKAGELGDVDLRDYYVTFMTSVFRSIRFGASSAHGKATSSSTAAHSFATWKQVATALTSKKWKPQ